MKNQNVKLDLRYTAPVALINPATCKVSTAVDTQIGLFNMGGSRLEVYQNGAWTAFGGAWANTGLGLITDATADDGLQISQGLAANLSPYYFTVGNGPFYGYFVAALDNVSAVDNFLFGFRKSAAYVGVTANGTGAGSVSAAYTDYFMVGIHGDGNGVDNGKFYQIDELNNANARNTALTKAALTDGQYLAVKVNVATTGAATFTIGVGATVALAEADLAADASALAFTFDATDQLIPTAIIVNNAEAAAATTTLVKWEVGYQTV